MATPTEPAAPLDERRAVWSRYWAGGALHSCGGSFDGNYSGEIREFWREAFAPLGAGARLLDIATGNGPIPKLMLDLRPGVDVQCDAVDLASVAPAWPQSLPAPDRARLRFHQGVQAERLPFADAGFDLVVSQYGLEYSDLETSVPELLRVLKPAGRVRLVVHHAEALPVKLGFEELRHLDWLQSPQGLLAATAAMLAPMARAATPEGRAALRDDPAAQAVRRGFDRLQVERETRAAGSPCPDVLNEVATWIAQAFQAAHTGGEAQGQAALAGIQRALDDSRLRLQELCDHALDESAARALCLKLEENGQRRASAEPLQQQGRLMAWAIRAG